MTATLEKSPVVVRKRAVSSFEQVELWPHRPAQVEEAFEAPAVSAVSLEASLQTACSTSHVEEVVETPVRQPRLSRKIVTNSPPAGQSPAGQPGRHIARFLKVNGAIDGVKSQGIRFDLPARGLSNMLRLWRGSSEATEFIPVH